MNTQTIDTAKFKFSFTNGAIDPNEATVCLKEISQDHQIGAHSFFFGQVRADKIKESNVWGIDYTTNKELAEKQFNLIISEAKKELEVEYINIIHSIGTVKTGELCLLVAAACGHRKESFKAIEYIVERIKKEIPIWGKELLQDQSHQWKTNKF